MVRLKCSCGHIWKESKKQQESEMVYCPKCEELNHAHSKPINPPKPFKTVKRKKVEVKIPQPINPYERKTWHQEGFGGRTLSHTPDKVKRKKTRLVEK